jgi:hypothetical protein
MPTQPPNARFRQQVRGFYAWLGSLLVAGIGPLLGIQLIHSGTLAGRIAGVVLGSVAWLPIVAVIAAIVRAGDEFHQRIHLVALAWAFASGMVLLMFLDGLVLARFIRQPRLAVIWLAFAALWVIWLIVVKRHFDRAS